MAAANELPTYVMLGYGINDDQAIIKNAYASNHGQLLTPLPNETSAGVVARIGAPAINLVIYCHGDADNGAKFIWNGDKPLAYKDLYQSLKDKHINVASITLAICEDEGGISPEALKAAPAGTIVQTVVAPKSVITKGTYTAFANESADAHQSTDLLLEALDNFNPSYYQKTVTYMNSKLSARDKLDADPSHALTSTLYVAGPQPQTIDLMKEMKRMAASAATQPKVMDWIKQAVRDVKSRFDSAGPDISPTSPGKIIYHDATVAADKAVDQQIDAIAGNLRKNIVPQIDHGAINVKNDSFLQQVNDVRIGLGITAAYLQESGQLQADVNNATNSAKPASVAKPRQR